MKENKNRLPELNIEGVYTLSQIEMKGIKGGFLSIGWNCSERNKCPRHHTKTWSIDERECHWQPIP